MKHTCLLNPPLFGWNLPPVSPSSGTLVTQQFWPTLSKSKPWIKYPPRRDMWSFPGGYKTCWPVDTNAWYLFSILIHLNIITKIRGHVSSKSQVRRHQAIQGQFSPFNQGQSLRRFIPRELVMKVLRTKRLLNNLAKLVWFLTWMKVNSLTKQSFGATFAWGC